MTCPLTDALTLGLSVSTRVNPRIQGTSITLQTEEEIQEWIAQRKARWPTAGRVAQKVCVIAIGVMDID